MRVSNCRKSEETEVFLVSGVFGVSAGAHSMGSIRAERNQQWHTYEGELWQFAESITEKWR